MRASFDYRYSTNRPDGPSYADYPAASYLQITPPDETDSITARSKIRRAPRGPDRGERGAAWNRRTGRQPGPDTGLLPPRVVGAVRGSRQHPTRRRAASAAFGRSRQRQEHPMSSQTTDRPSQNPSDPAAAAAAAAGTNSGVLSPTTHSQLVTERGATSIADSVVEKIAGTAARGVPGIYAMGTGRARTFGAVREMIPGSGGLNAAQGVSVQVGRTQAAVDLDIVPEYGFPVAELALAVQREVISMVEQMTGLKVLEVNIAVDDMHMPGDDDHDQQSPARVH